VGRRQIDAQVQGLGLGIGLDQFDNVYNGGVGVERLRVVTGCGPAQASQAEQVLDQSRFHLDAAADRRHALAHTDVDAGVLLERGSGDTEILEAAPPFMCLRALVLASPLWYPDLTREVRLMLLRLAERVLEAAAFSPGGVEEYLR
jgi:hypothetical protein